MHLSLSLSLTLLILYTYINNCLHVQYLPLDEKRTSVVTVGMQVLRTSANQLATNIFFFRKWQKRN